MTYFTMTCTWSVQLIFVLLCFSMPNGLSAETDEIRGPMDHEGKIIAPPTTDWDARLEYARVLSYLKKFQEAEKEYEKLRAEKPDSSLVKTELAQMYYYQEKYDEALKLLDSLPESEHTGKVEQLYGDIYMVQKQYERAEKQYQKALELTTDKDKIKFKLADMLSWQQRYDESLQIYEELLAKHEDDIQLRRKYAMVLLWAGQEEKAAEELKKTLP